MDFVGRKLIIATKHEKEKVIGPLVEKQLGAEWFIDTLASKLNPVGI